MTAQAADATIAVVASSAFVSITVETGSSSETCDIHLHPGGQGIWVARMLAGLGERPVVCAPLGGETGRAISGLAQEWDIELDAVVTGRPSAAYVHDRRSGAREEVARSAVPELGRHDVDDWYGRVLDRAIAAGTCVVTGRWTPTDVPTDVYRRLGADLEAAGVATVGDLHGDELDAYLEAGRLDWLKVSRGDLVDDGRLGPDDDGEEAALSAARELVEAGACRVVLSRAEKPALAVTEDGAVRIAGPLLEVVDPTGSGDSMTAGLAMALRRGMSTEDALRTAWAAGAANVTRHGLGSGSDDLIKRLAQQATIEEVGAP